MLAEDQFRLRLARLQSSESWTNPSNNEDEFTFVFLKGGIGKYVSANATPQLLPGDVLVFSGRSAGKLYASEKNDCVFTSFCVPFEHLYPLFANNEISLLHDVKANFKAAKIYPRNGALAIECGQLLEAVQTQSTLEQRSQLLRIVAVILSDEFKNVHTQRSGMNWAEDHVIQVFEKLSSSELLSLSADELAGKFGCSRRHLNRLFHQHFGLSITALKMEMRLLKAVSLLRDPREKVINVAEQCGFNHLGLFNICFKRRYGISPGQWRKIDLVADKSSKQKNESKQTCLLYANGLCPLAGQMDVFHAPLKAQISAKVTEIAGGKITGGASSAADFRMGDVGA
jgi:AraC-like DNA-binding protein